METIWVFRNSGQKYLSNATTWYDRNHAWTTLSTPETMGITGITETMYSENWTYVTDKVVHDLERIVSLMEEWEEEPESSNSNVITGEKSDPSSRADRKSTFIENPHIG